MKRLQKMASDIGRENAKRPTDAQLLKQLRKQHPTWTREKIADVYGLSL